MKSKASSETERFVDLARKLVAVPKKDIDKAIEQDRKKREKKAPKNESRKKRS